MYKKHHGNLRTQVTCREIKHKPEVSFFLHFSNNDWSQSYDNGFIIFYTPSIKHTCSFLTNQGTCGIQ